MAIAPLRKRFLQQSRESETQKNISNFGLRTGQRFGDIARGQLFEQDLAIEQQEKQQQARVALQFRQQEETERQAKVAEEQRGQQIEQRKEERKDRRRSALNKVLFGDFGPIADAIT